MCTSFGRYFERKRQAAKKEMKTLEASQKVNVLVQNYSSITILKNKQCENASLHKILMNAIYFRLWNLQRRKQRRHWKIWLLQLASIRPERHTGEHRSHHTFKKSWIITFIKSCKLWVIFWSAVDVVNWDLSVHILRHFVSGFDCVSRLSQALFNSAV